MSDVEPAEGTFPEPTDRVTLSIEVTFVIDRLRALDPDFTVYLQAQLDQLLAGLASNGAQLGSQATVLEIFEPNQSIDLTQPQVPGFRRTG
jgi:hypothetical protein